MDTETEVHLSRIDVEERVARSRQGAAVEGDAERVRRGVRMSHDPLDLIQVASTLRGGRGELVDRERTGDPAPVLHPVTWRGGDVVGDPHDTNVDPLASQAIGRSPEVEPIPRVVAEPEHDSRTAVGGASNAVDLLGRGRREDLTQHRAVGESRPHHAVVRRVVPRPTADHERDLAGQRAASSTKARGVRYALDVVGMRGGEAREYAFLERVGVVEDVGHGNLTESSRSARAA